MTREQFIDLLYANSKNSSRNVMSTPSSDSLDKKLSGIDLRLDKYGNCEIKTYWYSGGKPKDKGFVIKIPKDKYIETAKFIYENDIVDRVNDTVDIFSEEVPTSEVQSKDVGSESLAKTRTDSIPDKTLDMKFDMGKYDDGKFTMSDAEKEALERKKMELDKQIEDDGWGGL